MELCQWCIKSIHLCSCEQGVRFRSRNKVLGSMLESKDPTATIVGDPISVETMRRVNKLAQLTDLPVGKVIEICVNRAWDSVDVLIKMFKHNGEPGSGLLDCFTASETKESDLTLAYKALTGNFEDVPDSAKQTLKRMLHNTEKLKEEFLREEDEKSWKSNQP